VFALVAAACSGGETESSTTTEAGVTETSAVPQFATTSSVPPNVIGECPGGFCVKYHIREDAAWADGEPVTAGDFAFTYNTRINPQLDIDSREGYDKMSGYEIIDDKTFLAIFDDNYAPWQTLFADVLPEHELADKPFNDFWDDGITLGSGPFVFAEWSRDERIVLQRNPNYWGGDTDMASGLPLGDVHTIQIVFIEDNDTMVQALRGGEVDLINPQPQVSLVEDVADIEGVDQFAKLTNIWEHFDFNQDDPRLQQQFVRQAIAQGIDREAIVDVIVRPLNPDAQRLGNTIWINSSVNYVDHFNERFPHDPVAAEALLVDNGCIKGADDVYECNGERLSFTWTTTAGNFGRERQFELAQADLAKIGIEVTAKFRPTSEVFADQNFYGGADSWQILNFAWIGKPEPSERNSLYYCESDTSPHGFGNLNNLRFCDEEVDALVRSTDFIVDPGERAAVYNQADDMWLAQIPMIPLYQKPQYLAWDSAIQNVIPNPNESTDTWNAGAWSGKETVIFGAEQQPGSMQKLEKNGNEVSTTLWWRPVIEGAYILNPAGEYVPLLIESAEPIIPAS
jgi:peptide/nickel transport system substrate-binding protein